MTKTIGMRVVAAFAATVGALGRVDACFANAGTGGRKVRDNLAVALALAGETAQAGQVLREELNPTDTATALDGYRALKPRAVP